ncbi:MAG: non-canonical purine NTP pyrophosphatase [Deltaproteobacteria bacterium]|nr:non-canonical purine NTP pyrophosphatase [Deltaproteobacteria bacterium]
MTQGARKVVFATLNPGKVREVAGILAGLPVEVVGLRDAGVAELPEETGETFLDNAILKAAHAFRATGLPAMADDSGLEVAALGGKPGVHSARFAGAGHDHAANIRKLLSDLAGVADRRARFVCTAVLVGPAGGLPGPGALPKGILRLDAHPALPAGAAAIVAEGEVPGRIIDDSRGAGGFGYDPVFFHDGEGATFAEIPEDRKNALSHRGTAFRGLRTVLDR